MSRHLQGAGRAVLGAAGVWSRAREHPDARALLQPTGKPSMPVALGELGSAFAAARLAGASPRLFLAPRGDDHPVVDIPGFRAPEFTGAPLRAYLRALGYDARGWGFGTNMGDPRRDIDRLSERVLALVKETESTVSLVGWSLGGVIARGVARRHPESVRQVITYGTPVIGGPARTGTASEEKHGAGTRGDRGSRRPSAGSIRVPTTAVLSRRDGIVAWQTCIDRSSTYGEHVEVSSTHLGMGVDPDVWALVADRLARSSGKRIKKGAGSMRGPSPA